MNKQELIEHYENLLKYDVFDDKKKSLYEQFLVKLERLDEPQKVTVPQFVADWYEKNKDDFETSLFNVIYGIFRKRNDNKLSKFEEWLVDGKTEPFQTLVNMHQFGYTVEKEKRYIVKVKGISVVNGCLKCDVDNSKWFFSGPEETGRYRAKHTIKELDKAGFGWVFDCTGIEIEEVRE